MEKIRKEELYRTMGYPVGSHLVENLPIIKGMVKIIKEEIPKEFKKDFCLVCTGSSGALICGIISYKLKCKVYHVKKQGEISHSERAEVIFNRFKIIVDDMIQSGESINRILDAYSGTQFDLLIVSGTNSFESERINKIICG